MSYTESDLALAAVTQNPRLIKYVCDEVCKGTSSCESACLQSCTLSGQTIKDLPANCFTPERILAAVKSDGLAIQFLIEDQKTNEICLESVKQNGLAIAFIDEAKRTDEIKLEAIKQHWLAIMLVGKANATNEMILEACKQKGDILQILV